MRTALKPQKQKSIPVDKGLPDVCKATEDRGISLQRVGIRGVDFPLSVMQKAGGQQQVVAKWEMFSGIPHHQRGTHMSRFPETLMDWLGRPLSGHNFKDLVFDFKERLKNTDVYIAADFPYLVMKEAPVTKKATIMAYKCRFVGRALGKSGYEFIQQVRVPVQLCCPCSKELALSKNYPGLGKGAHNQRAEITVQLKVDKQPGPWIEDIVQCVEAQGSVPLYPLLKRKDEQYVTIHGYEHPKFVEDAARDVAIVLQGFENVKWFKVKVESFESIHDHSAIAYVGRMRKGHKWIASHGSFY